MCACVSGKMHTHLVPIKQTQMIETHRKNRADRANGAERETQRVRASARDETKKWQHDVRLSVAARPGIGFFFSALDIHLCGSVCVYVWACVFWSDAFVCVNGPLLHSHTDNKFHFVFDFVQCFDIHFSFSLSPSLASTSSIIYYFYWENSIRVVCLFLLMCVCVCVCEHFLFGILLLPVVRVRVCVQFTCRYVSFGLFAVRSLLKRHDRCNGAVTRWPAMFATDWVSVNHIYT